MSIREKGYHTWTGQLVEHPRRWTPIMRFTIKQIYQKRFSKVLFAINIIPVLVFLFFTYLLYIANSPEMGLTKFFSQVPEEIKSLDFFFYTFYCFGPILFFRYILLSLFCGSELISADMRSNAFPLYFSKPLRALDYVLGKFLSILFYLLIFSLLPAIILLLTKIAFAGFTDITPALLVGILIYPLLTGSVMALFTLWISTLTANSRWVKILFFIFYLGLPSIGGILTGISGGKHQFMLFDLNVNLVQTGHFFFKVESEFGAAPWISALILLSIGSLLFFLIIHRIKRVEV